MYKSVKQCSQTALITNLTLCYMLYNSWVVSVCNPTRLDSVPAAEGYFLVRPDPSGAAAEIVSEFNAPEKGRNGIANAIVSTAMRGKNFCWRYIGFSSQMRTNLVARLVHWVGKGRLLLSGSIVLK